MSTNELVALGREFDAAFARWRELLARYNAVHRSDACGDAAADSGIADVVARIADARAGSLDDLVVKARAASWRNESDLFEAADGDDGSAEGAFPAVVADLLQLLAPGWIDELERTHEAN
jgi:hypothetical protein